MASLADLPWRLLVWLSRYRTINGLRVNVATPATEAEQVFERAGDALRLIERYDPAWHAEIRRERIRLLFTEAAGGSYLAGINACRIAISYANRVTPLELSMMIVHEAAHARLAKAGAQYRGAERERIERSCVQAEIEFAERVPGSEQAIQRARALLETAWWDEGRHSEDTVADLKNRGVPSWLARRIVARSIRRSKVM